MTRKYLMRERIFLNEDFENSVYVVATVTNSKSNEDSIFDNPDCGAKLKISGAYDYVDLQFALELPDQARESLKQIKALEKLLRQFRKAVEKEARNRKKLSYEHIRESVIR